MEPSSRSAFLIALNPEEDTKLPYLLHLPLEGGLTLKTRETWPRSSRLYCHPFDGPWPEDAEIVEETPVAICRRRGMSIDLVLDRPRLARSQFVFTQVRGRPAIFWQTQKTARASNPGGRIPRSRTLDEDVTSSSTRASATPSALRGEPHEPSGWPCRPETMQSWWTEQ